MNETRQVEMVAFSGTERIFIWSSGPELHATDDSRQGREEEATQNKRTNSQNYGFFRMIRVRSGLVKTPVVPTAQSVPFGVAVIPCKRLLEFGAFGLGTKFHCEPSQFSVKVNWALPWSGTIY